MDLQKHNPQGLIPLEDTLLVKIPEIIYQEWYSQAHSMNFAWMSIEQRQRVMFDNLRRWALLNYPSYGIVAFEDYSNQEAEEVSRKIGRTITWGMYVLLQIGGSMQPVSITDKLLEI